MLLFAILACILGWAQFIASALGAKIAPENLPLGPLVAAVITAAILALAAPALIIAAWGAHVSGVLKRIGPARADAVREVLGAGVRCLGRSADGSPRSSSPRGRICAG